MSESEPAVDAVAARRAVKDRVLEAAFSNAAFDGWSRKTLAAAAADAAVDIATARRLFPQAGASLLDWLDDWADRRMLDAADGRGLAGMPVRARITWLVRRRLEILAPHREAVRRAAVARLLPAQAVGGGQAAWTTVDAMWRAAGVGGGREEGFSWYSRRATLAGVLVSTFLYWLQDQSDDQAATWSFLDRRIADVMRVGEAGGRLRSMLGSLPGMSRAFSS